MSHLFLPLNRDYSKTVIISSEEHQWIESPVFGVTRCLLEREEAESGWATSLVRYTAGIQFPAHQHLGGEQIYVIEGTFSDETGDYAANTYVQNPIGSLHHPFSKEGTLIFVRLGATDKVANQQIVIADLPNQSNKKIQTGLNDYISLQQETCGKRFTKNNTEILLLKGLLTDSSDRKYAALSWFRIAPHHHIEFEAATDVEYLERPLFS